MTSSNSNTGVSKKPTSLTVRLWKMSTLFRITVISLPLTIAELALSIVRPSMLLVLAPLVLAWKLLICALSFRRIVRPPQTTTTPATMTGTVVHFAALTVLMVFSVALAPVDSESAGPRVMVIYRAASALAVADAVCLSALIFVVLRVDEREWAHGPNSVVHDAILPVIRVDTTHAN